MDILWANYNEVLNVIYTQLSEASFVSIDCEFTGLRLADKAASPDGHLNGPSDAAGEGDEIHDENGNATATGAASVDQLATIQSRYSDYRVAAEAFQIIQLGLCIVQANQDTGEYVMLPYNFYVSPILPLKFGIDRRFLFQMSAAAFHLRNRFDFNKWLANGVPYLNRDEQTQIEARALRFITQEFEDIHVDHSGQQFLDSALPGLDAWANDPNPETSWFNIAVSNSYQKRIVHQTIRKSYPQLYGLGRRNFIQIRRKNKNDSIESVKSIEKYNKLMLEVNQYAGIRHIFDHLSHIKIPIVGHNVFVDLINIYAKFVSSLPSSIEEFAHQMSSLFPMIIDTKYFGTMCDVDDSDAHHSSMKDMLDDLRSVVYPIYKTHPEFTKYDNREYEHEAGWDACETAKLFLKQGGQHFYLDVERSLPTQYSSYDSEEGDEQIRTEFDDDVSMIYNGDANISRRKRHESSQVEQMEMDEILMSFSRPRSVRGINWLEESLQIDEQNWDVPGSSYQVDSGDDWNTDQTVSAWEKFEIEQIPQEVSVLDVDRPMADVADAVEPLPPPTNVGVMKSILPPFSSAVWGPIANRLRITGTNERVLIL
ncbi:ribonuclease H-like domain-containing protein, partial [Lipomyces chichibuensis]|uniref:ribonuclease H-like domain-containing protein n=1 Tax=Lipomyces chichibuensis TaxID=1546026 RepID=UPI00334369DE